MRKAVVFIACFPVHCYRLFIKPLKGGSICAHTPTCSQYSLIAIKRHGAIVGWWMTGKRLLRCSPFTRKRKGISRSNKGYDPVPYKLKGGAKWVV